MIKFFDGKVDARHTILTTGYMYKQALQINEDGTYELVFYKDLDDVRYSGAEVVFDATDEEIENYRRYSRRFKKGDLVEIKRGRKMVGQTKTVSYVSYFRPRGTYGHDDVRYLNFTDGTKVASKHCDFK